MASTRIQSSNVTIPVSSSHQYLLHHGMDSVALRIVSNSRRRLFSLARTAGLKVVPVRRSCSSSLQNVGRSSSGRNLIYSVRGFKTPTSLISGQEIVACNSRNVRIAPRVVCRVSQYYRRRDGFKGPAPCRTRQGRPRHLEDGDLI